MEEDNIYANMGYTTIEMVEATGQIYASWDELLNEIYGILRENLSENDMSTLKSQQLKWITERDNAAKSAADEQGGSMSSVIYNETLAKYTKERCYTLSEKYFN